MRVDFLDRFIEGMDQTCGYTLTTAYCNSLAFETVNILRRL